ncbi:MAG: SAM-dependent methyltransferase [Oscillospiraceae bacterium]|jgi:tRNA-Thr(GGU) m(6)t(6)A37 methyltransferase TsaA|nr:SAM-dependent methyltransferase [Oscillospiraceae bacterium]
MEKLMLNAIGEIKTDEGNFRVVLNKSYAKGLAGLEGFGHVSVLWWFSGCDSEDARSVLTQPAPYKGGPAELGTFATRSPLRPNPIAVSCAGVTYIDGENGILGLTWIDAEDGTPVLDIKPYTPSLDRVEAPSVPEWCKGWPKSLEEASDFDWEGLVFTP